MSYTEQAKQINSQLSSALNCLKGIVKTEDHKVLEEIEQSLLDAMLRFGQVAKFRCRSNTAYDNFSKEVLEGIAVLAREQPEYLNFEVLKVKEVLK